MPKMIIFIEVASKLQKKVSSSWSAMHAKNDHLHWGGLETKKKVSPSLSKMHAKNDHLHWGCFKTPKKSIIIMERNACQKWSSSFRGLQNQKNVSSALNRFYVKTDHYHRGVGSKKLKNTTQNKISSWLSRFHVKNEHYHWRGSKHIETLSSSLDMIAPHPQLSLNEVLENSIFLLKHQFSNGKN